MKIILAQPRGFCAGVDRAIKMLEQALEFYGVPIYARHAIVHNRHVIKSFEERGVIFVEDLREIPKGATVVFSAHGVSPAIRKKAEERSLKIIDATCPLVAKVHREVKRYSREGYTVLLVGHKNHVEVIGTRGEASENVVVIETVEDAQRVAAPDSSKVAYATQTTLSVDDTQAIIDVLKNRFPNIEGPSKPDICYATQNRQEAIKKLAQVSEVIFIVGSDISSNSNRLKEIAEACGVKAYLIENADDIKPEMFSDNMKVGVSSGASTPEFLVREALKKLQEFTTIDFLNEIW